MREIVINSEGKQKLLDKARTLIAFSLYTISAGTLLEYVSVPAMLKILGFALASHAFYYLWKSQKAI